MTIKNLYPTVRPALDLNFAQTKQLDPRITFSRSSSGTYFDNTGLLRSAGTNQARFDHDPTTGESLGLLVEEARANLVDDQTLSSSSLIGVVRTPQTSILNPFGNVQGVMKLQCTASTNGHGITAPSVSLTSGKGVHSIFVKKGNHRYVALESRSNLGGGYSVLYFDFDTENITGGNRGSDAGFVKYPNGWYRIYATNTQDGNNPTYGFRLLGSMNFAQWTATGNEFVYYYGPQLEAGSFPTSYIPTPATFTSRSTTATYYDASGTIQTAGINVARDDAYFPDENGVMRPAGLLLEGASENLLKYSEQFDNAAWGKIRVSVSANAAVSPDGATTADKLIENSTLDNRHARISISSLTGNYTFSCFMKASERTYGYLSWGTSVAKSALFNLSTGVVVSSSGCTASIQKFANSWYRCSITVVAANENFACVGPATTNTTNLYEYQGDGTSGIFIWGAQLEASPYPTSYIPTTTSTVTRAADVSSFSSRGRSADVAEITGSNFSSWYNQSAGTLVGSTRVVNKTQGGVCGAINSGGSDISEGFAIEASTTQLRAVNYLDSGSTNNDIINNSPQLGLNKIAIAGSTTDDTTGAYFNGLTGSVNASLTQGYLNVAGMKIGDRSGQRLTGTISRLTYYPVRLADSVLQAITQ